MPAAQPHDHDPLPLGSWARCEGVVGVVAASAADTVTLFSPASRRWVVAPREDTDPVPAGAVTVMATVSLPVPHGVDESDVRRWLAVLTDHVLGERAAAALREAGLDDGVAAATVDVRVVAATDGRVCVAGHVSGGDAEGDCPACGRRAWPALRAAP